MDLLATDILDALGGGVVVYDPALCILYWNRAMERMSGLPAEAVLGRPIAECFEHVEREGVSAILARALEGEVVQSPDLPVTVTSTGLSGRYSATYTPLRDGDGAIVGVVSSVFDVTERAQLEEELRDAKERIALTLAGSGDGLWEFDVVPRNLVCDDDWVRQLGYEPGEPGRSYSWWVDRIHPDDRHLFEQTGPDGIPGLASLVEGEYRVKRADGAWMWVWTRGSCVNRDNEGRPLRLLGTHRDITARRKAEDALRGSEQALKLRTQIADVFLHEPESPFPTVVRILSEAFGCEHGVLGHADDHGNLVLASFSPGIWSNCELGDGSTFFSRDRMPALFANAFLNGEATFHNQGHTVPPGDAPSERAMAAPFVLDDGPFGMIALGHRESDFTTRDLELLVSIAEYIAPIVDARLKRVQEEQRRRRAEEAWLSAQRLESLGVLAGGVAHDFNNILTSVLANISMAKDGVAPGSEALELLDESERAAREAAGLTRQLLTFAQGGEPVKSIFDLGATIEESARFAARGTTAVCELDHPDESLSVEADPGQIRQVVHNVVLNAIQSMETGGTVRLQLRRVDIPRDEDDGLATGCYARLTVRDTGVGMTAEQIARVFDPYFTTKPGGRGLGLATCHSIMSRHGGRVDIESAPGEGTAVTMLIPASDETVRLAPIEVPFRATGTERVLVMDDDRGVARVLLRTLDRLGFDAEHALEGSAAIDLFVDARNEGRPFDIVIVDLTVPGGMGCEETVREIRKIDPGVLAVVSSGYSSAPVMSQSSEYGFDGVLPKPFDPDAVSRILAEVMAKRSEEVET